MSFEKVKEHQREHPKLWAFIGETFTGISLVSASAIVGATPTETALLISSVFSYKLVTKTVEQKIHWLAAVAIRNTAFATIFISQIDRIINETTEATEKILIETNILQIQPEDMDALLETIRTTPITEIYFFVGIIVFVLINNRLISQGINHINNRRSNSSEQL